MGQIVPFAKRAECRVLAYEKPHEVLHTGRDMRSMCDLQCAHCQHEWMQPKAGGLCPKCHGSATLIVRKRVNQLDRL